MYCQNLLHVVADPPGAVGAQIGEVLADLGGGDPGDRGQFVRRGADLIGAVVEDLQVDREPLDRGAGYRSLHKRAI